MASSYHATRQWASGYGPVIQQVQQVERVGIINYGSVLLIFVSVLILMALVSCQTPRSIANREPARAYEPVDQDLDLNWPEILKTSDEPSLTDIRRILNANSDKKLSDALGAIANEFPGYMDRYVLIKRAVFSCPRSNFLVPSCLASMPER